MQILRLSNRRVRIEVSPERGGEIVSLQCRIGDRWTELLYTANRGWKGGAPWLFPAVGRNFLGRRLAWRCGGRVYPMPLHGFARLLPWIGRRRGTGIECRLESDARTRRYYPFDFSLKARYSLTSSGLRARIEVAASRNNNASMPFSLGNHISLRATKDSRISTNARRQLLLSRRGLLNGRSRTAELLRGVRLLDAPSLLDAVVGEFPAPTPWFALRDRDVSIRLSQHSQHGGPAFFVLYGNTEKGFFCPEPWLGKPDSLVRGQGVVRLAPGRRFRWDMRIRIDLGSG